LGLASFPLVTGGKGIHVVAPLVRRHEWPVVKTFAEAIARRMADDRPDRYVAVMSKARRKGRIFIDYLRNERGGTAIAPYSPRARKDAPVAWPVEWSDLGKVTRADQFRLDDVDADDAKGWAGYGDVRQSLKAASLAAVGVDKT
jgi:bifunctional non-homologous end joining protein LigD